MVKTIISIFASVLFSASIASAASLSTGGVGGTLDINAPLTSCAAVFLTCDEGDVCQCIELKGKFTDGTLKNKMYDALLAVDLSHLYPNGNYNVCFGASSVTTVGDVSFSSAGLDCNGPVSGTLVYSGAFTATGGKAMGGGVTSLSGNAYGTSAIFFDGVGSNF